MSKLAPPHLAPPTHAAPAATVASAARVADYTALEFSKRAAEADARGQYVEAGRWAAKASGAAAVAAAIRSLAKPQKEKGE